MTETQTAIQKTPSAKTGIWEERWHPLREEWVIVAAHRQNRPWSGEVVESGDADAAEDVDDWYLCPRNVRVGGATNDDYQGVFVFDNDLPSVGGDAPTDLEAPSGIYRNRPANGAARVICYSPKHNLSLAEMTASEIANVIRMWQEEYRNLGSRDGINHVLIFENKGEVVGVSNPHPHGQIYATNFVFKAIETETKAAEKHFSETGRSLFADIIKAEQEDGRRIIFENENAIAFMPYFARYAYEVYVAPKKTYPSVADIPANEVADFAEALRSVVV
jgi:UDPglucose--hexose-1-phosphate uridylyltransferase